MQNCPEAVGHFCMKGPAMLLGYPIERAIGRSWAVFIYGRIFHQDINSYIYIQGLLERKWLKSMEERTLEDIVLLRDCVTKP